MDGAVMTVLGPVPAGELGTVLPHEHLICDIARVTNVPEHKLYEVPLAVAELRYYQEAGGATLVDVTSIGCGRDAVALRRIAEASGLHVVMGAGWYRDPFLPEEVNVRSTVDLADEIVRDLTVGVGDTGIRAGIIGEVGCRLSHMSPAEERSFRAAAKAHRRTGATITTHADKCPVGLVQLDILIEQEGADPRRVIIGHADSYPEPDYHEAIARRGAWVQFDTIRGMFEWEIEKRVKLVVEFVRRGYLRQLLLSHDVFMRPHLHAFGGEGYDYLLRGFLPRLRMAGLSDEQIRVLTVENPRAALAGS